MQELEGSVAIVTGAARNIGRAIALDLADAGAAVTVLARSDFAGVKAVAAEIESRGGRRACDSGRRDAARRRAAHGGRDAEEIRPDRHPGQQCGRAPRRGPFEDMSLDSWHQVLAVILDGPFLCAQAALPALEKAAAARSSILAGSPPIPAPRTAPM